MDVFKIYNSDNFEDGVLKAVNLGNDADTTGAIYGQLAGAYYGLEAIPQRFKEKLVMKELILSYSEKLIEGLEKSKKDEEYMGDDVKIWK